MEGLQLIAVGGAEPSRVVTNDDLSKLVDTSDEWITTRTGIRQRYFCAEGEDTATLAVQAARKALERSGLQPAQIGCCVCATVSGVYAAPSTACLVQRELGLAQDIPVLDVNAACSGFIYGAAVLELTPDAEFAVDLGARGDMAIEFPTGGPIRMDGRAVFRFAVDALPRTLHAVLNAAHRTLDEVDWVVCHQANSRIIDHCIKKLGADPAKFYKNMDRHGNTSAASIPVALYELQESGRLQPGMRIACIGFGGGLTWGGMLITVKGSAV